MVNWNAEPLKGVNDIKFGMKRETVRKTMGSKVKEFRKSKFSKVTTDDFEFCHVFYNAADECEAVEIFAGNTVSINCKIIFPGTLANAKTIINDLDEEYGSYSSKSQSIGIYAPSGEIESILFAIDGYYSQSKE